MDKVTRFEMESFLFIYFISGTVDVLMSMDHGVCDDVLFAVLLAFYAVMRQTQHFLYSLCFRLYFTIL